MSPRSDRTNTPEHEGGAPGNGHPRGLARTCKGNDRGSGALSPPESTPEAEGYRFASPSLRGLTRHQRKAANKAAWASASAAAAGDLAVRDAIWKRRSASLESADQQAAVAAPPPDFFATRRRRLVAYIAERKAELTKPGHVPYRTQKERGLARAEMELASLPSAAHG